MADLATISFTLFLTPEEQTAAGREAIKNEVRERLAKPDLDISIEMQGVE